MIGPWRGTYESLPELVEARRLALAHNVLPITHSFVSDLETPVSAFLKLGAPRRAFLLESAEQGQHLGRFSFLGVGARALVTYADGRLTVQENGRRLSVEHDDPFTARGRPHAQLPAAGERRGGGTAAARRRPRRLLRLRPRAAPGASAGRAAGRSRPPGDGVPAGRHGARLRPPQAQHHDRRQRVRRRARRGRALRARRGAHRRSARQAGRAPPCRRGRTDGRRGRGRRGPDAHGPPGHVLDDARAVRGRRRAHPRVHLRRRRFPGCALPAVQHAGRRLALLCLPRRARREPVAVPLLHRLRRLALCGSAPRRSSPSRASASRRGRSPARAARRGRRRGRRARSRTCAPTRRSAPSTSCWSTSAATTSAASASSARCDVDRAHGRSSATRTSCTSSRTCAGSLRAGHDRARRRCAPRSRPAPSRGAPKVRAMEIIDELEPRRRGPYAGAVGYFELRAATWTCIAIRTLVSHGRQRLRAGRRRASCRLGSGAGVRRRRQQGARVLRARRLATASRRARVTRALGVTAPGLLIDNYDSFTYNLVQYLGELGAEVDGRAQRRDRPSTRSAHARPTASSSRPAPARRTRPASRWTRSARFARRGCRSSASASATRPSARSSAARSCAPRALDARQDRARSTTDGAGVFAGLPNPFTATRYHSLVVERGRLPDVPRGHRLDRRGRDHGPAPPRRSPCEGVQFHPESILTDGGQEAARRTSSRMIGRGGRACR